MTPRPLHDPDYGILVQLVRELRVEQRVTQAELAERLGIAQSLVSKMERRERRLDVAELRRVCIALGVPLAFFIEQFEQALAGRKASIGEEGGGE